MTKIHWSAYLRMFLLGFLISIAMERAGYSETVVLLIMVGIGLFYPETVVERIEVPKDGTKN